MSIYSKGRFHASKVDQSLLEPFRGIYQGLLAEIIKRDPLSEMRDGSDLRRVVENISIDDAFVGYPSYDKKFLRALDEWPAKGDDYVVSVLSQMPIKGFRSSFVRAVLNGHDEIIRLFRSCFHLVYKLKIAHTNDQEKAAVQRFKENNAACENRDNQGYHGHPRCGYIERCRALVQEIASAGLVHERVYPAHGPGAVYEQHKKWLKPTESTYFDSIEEVFPAADHICVDYLHYMERLGLGLPSTYEDVPIRWNEKIPCKLAFVPKDARGPRAICTHPTNVMFVQKGQEMALRSYIASKVGSQIDIGDQTTNSDMARKGCILKYGTIDLSDASDRVPAGLVRYLFGEETYSWLSATRATEVEYQGKKLCDLHMFAPMGSALCFPVESLVFYAVAVASAESLGFAWDDVYVYGDDIIAPCSAMETIMADLAWFGFIPNTTKSYWQGFFRESCGYDAFNTANITPLRIKEQLTRDRIESWVAWGDAARRAHALGWNFVGTAISVALEQVIGYGKLPVGHYGSTGVCYQADPTGSHDVWYRWSGPVLPGETLESWPDDDPDEVEIPYAMASLKRKAFTGYAYHYLEHRVLQSRVPTGKVGAHAREHVRDALISLERENAERRLEAAGITIGQDTRYALPKRVKLKYGWTESR